MLWIRLLKKATTGLDPVLPPPAASTVSVVAVVLLLPVCPVPLDAPVVVVELPVVVMVSLLLDVEFVEDIEPVVEPPVVTSPLPPSSMLVVVSRPELWALPLRACPSASFTACTS
jgi:hypothetical protein